MSAALKRTFGTCDLVGTHWVIEAEPHVVMRLKRLFPRVANQSGALSMADTVEVCRDLEWFLERYPLKFTKAGRAHLTERARQHRETETLVAALLAGRREGPKFDMAIPPRDYQRVGAAMALATGSLLLADDVGLGKSCTAICCLTDPKRLPAVVVTLTHLCTQWRDEIAKFAPKLRTHILKSGQPYDLTKTSKTKKGQIMLTPEFPDVVITNYHKLAGWAETLAPVVQSVIWDEAQELRTGEDTAKGAAAAHIADNTTFRLGLTATPVYNHGGEIFNVLRCIAPGALGSHKEFSATWCQGFADRLSIKDPKAFGAYLRDAGLMLRRTRSEVKREIPPVTMVVQEVDADREELDRVESAAAELARIILGQGERVRGEKFRAAEELSHLVRQATGISKAPYVADFVRLLVESGEKVVLYGWHRACYDLWLERLKDLKPVLYTGSESASAKDESKKAFISGDSKVLIISLRAGAGLDGLQYACRTVVFGELDWSPGVHEQCIGRPARDGQPDPVVAYFMLANSGSDPIVSEALGLKRLQIEGIRNPDGGELLEQLDTGGGHVKRLAELYLKARGQMTAEVQT
jgi:SNF2 family DNA or RNA helicase